MIILRDKESAFVGGREEEWKITRGYLYFVEKMRCHFTRIGVEFVEDGSDFIKRMIFC